MSKNKKTKDRRYTAGITNKQMCNLCKNVPPSCYKKRNASVFNEWVSNNITKEKFAKEGLEGETWKQYFGRKAKVYWDNIKKNEKTTNKKTKKTKKKN